MSHQVASYGLYPSMSALYLGAEALKAAGFRQTDISVLYSDWQGTRAFTHDADRVLADGAVAGAATGASFGALLAYLAGIGAITFPNVGPFLAAGPIASTLAAISAAGCAGGLLGSLVTMGLPERDAERYEDRLRDGELMLTVHCDDEEWADRAQVILNQTGAGHIATGPDKIAA